MWAVLWIWSLALVGDGSVMVVMGDSLAAGYGLSKEEAFPALLEERLRAEGYEMKVVNAGLSGDTSAGGVRRLNWVLREAPDIFLLELGANDGLRGLPPEETRKNLQTIIDRVRAKYPETRILIAGMMAPPNLGDTFTDAFRGVFERIAKDNDLPMMPFLLEDVAGVPELNLPDGIHPTAEGHRIIAENLWPYVSPLAKAVANQK